MVSLHGLLRAMWGFSVEIRSAEIWDTDTIRRVWLDAREFLASQNIDPEHLQLANTFVVRVSRYYWIMMTRDARVPSRRCGDIGKALCALEDSWGRQRYLEAVAGARRVAISSGGWFKIDGHPCDIDWDVRAILEIYERGVI